MKNIDLLACLVAGMAENFSKQNKNKNKKKKRNPQKSKGKRKDRK